VDDAVIDEYAALIGPIGVALYCTLARHADRDGQSFPSFNRLQKLLGITSRTVAKYLKILETVGLIRRTRRYKDDTGDYLSTLYELLSVTPPPTVPNTVALLDEGQYPTVQDTVTLLDEGQYPTVPSTDEPDPLLTQHREPDNPARTREDTAPDGADAGERGETTEEAQARLDQIRRGMTHMDPEGKMYRDHQAEIERLEALLRRE